MGKNNHARTRSKLKIFKKKNKQKNDRGKFGKKEEKDCGNCEKKEKKKKKKFWSRWLNFFRGFKNVKRTGSHPSCVDSACSSRKTNEENESSTVYLASTASSMDLMEIPIEHGQKMSKILIKPSKNGIKSMITKCDGNSLMPLLTEEGVFTPVRNSCNIYELKKDGKKFVFENSEADKRMNYHSEKRENESRHKSENLLTSALYIRKDLDKVVESAVFIEPNLSNDYLESKKSDDLSQKSMNPNQRQINCGIINNESGFNRTFKTVSEPTWNEREKIRYQQKLQENINEIIEQFIFIERDDVINFSLSQHRVVEERRRKVRFNPRTSTFPISDNAREPFIKELSREVSPEILVNIKPFKEYLSGACMNYDVSSNEESLEMDTMNEHQMTHRQKLKKSKTFREREKRDDVNFKYHCPVIRSNPNVKSQLGLTNAAKGRRSVEKTITEETSDEKVLDNMADCEEWPYRRFEGPHSRSHVKSEVCTILGFYKAYSEPESVFVKNDTKKKTSLDDVLENLDDSDHDAIFKKNLVYFKKKINVPTHYGNIKSSSQTRSPDKKKVKIQKTKVEKFKTVPININQKLSEDMDQSKNFFSKDLLFKKHEKPKLGNLQRIKIKYKNKSQGILRNKSLLFSENQIVSKALAFRIESLPVRCFHTFREIQNIIDVGFRIMVEKVQKISNSVCLIKRGMLHVEGGTGDELRISSRGEQFHLNPKIKDKGEVEEKMSLEKCFIADELAVNPNEINEGNAKIVETSSLLIQNFTPNAAECFYLVENRLLTNLKDKISKSGDVLLGNEIQKTPTVSVKKDGVEGKASDHHFKTNVEKKNVLIYTSEPKKVIEILSNSSFEFPFRRFEPCNEPQNTSTSSKKYSSDTIMLRKLFMLKAPICKSEILKPPNNSNNNNPQSQKTNSNSKDTLKASSLKTSKPWLILGKKFSVGRKDLEDENNEWYSSDELAEEETKETNLDGEVIELNEIDEVGIDGFRVIYDGIEKEWRNGEIFPNGSSTRTRSTKSLPFSLKQKSSALINKQEGQHICDGETSKNPVICTDADFIETEKKNSQSPAEEIQNVETSESFERKTAAKLLKYKSISSPKETIVQMDFNPQEHRLRRSLNFTKDIEKLDLHTGKKKRIFVDKGVDIRRTGSALLESTTSKPGRESSVHNKDSIETENTFRSSIIAEELKTIAQYMVTDGKQCSILNAAELTRKGEQSLMEMTQKEHTEDNKEKKKIFIIDKNGGNIRKEVVAAFNSIKELSPCNDEIDDGNRRISLVIMLSKK